MTKTKNTWVGLVVLAMAGSTGCYSGVDDMDGAAGSGGGDSAADSAGSAGGGDTDDGSGPGGGPDSGGPDSGGDSGPPEGCLAGAIGCECLEGSCQGLSACIEGICTPAPPVPEVAGPQAAIGGMAVVLEGTVEGGDDDDDINVYESLLWEQVEGPTAVVAFEFSEEALAYIPGNAQADAELTFRLTARLGDVETSADYTIAVLPATPTGSMDETPDVAALGASVMGPAGGDEVWLGTDTGTLARAGTEGIAYSEELGSRITALAPYNGNFTLIAQPDAGVVSQFNANNNMVTPFLTELSGGGVLGPVSTMAIDNDDNIYMGTEDARIVMYDSPDGAEPAVTVTLYNLTVSPTALALGQHPVSPDIDNDDEGNVLYYGTPDGDVWQIGLTPAEVIDGPEVGVPQSYISVPGAGAVTGLSIDGQGNMWVAKSSGLYLVRRAIEAPPEVVRDISAPNGLGGYAGLRAADNSLTWIDPASGRVATLQTIQN